MSKFIFCNIAHMKYYRGITDDDKPANGGQYVTKTGKAYECYNFFPVNHFCYGYFQHVGGKLDLARVDKAGRNSDVLHGITVIFVANRKIVGYYENADMFRYWQSFVEPEFDKDHEDWQHWFQAREENVFLIPDEKRNFEIPTASKNGSGKGMGQANIWYADSKWAIENFLPKVEKYLDSIRGKYPVEFLTAADINKKIPPTNISVEDLFDRADERFNAGQYLQALQIFNYLIEEDLTPYEICSARYKMALSLEKLLLYDEAVENYKQAIQEFNRLKDEEKLSPVDLDCTWQLGRIYTVMKESSLAYSMWEKLFNEEKDLSEKCAALVNMMDISQAEEKLSQLRRLIAIYDALNTDEFKEDVQEFREILAENI